MRAIDELVELIAEFPGVGPRQARRIVQFVLGKDQSFREKIARALVAIRKSVSQCSSCFRFADGATDGLCPICADRNRDARLLMVVEKDVDVDGMEASGAYRGQYFVLGALIPMTRQRKNGNGVRLKEMNARIAKGAPNEIILALSTTPEGDYTAGEIARGLKAEHPTSKVSLLGRGLSVGAEIEYADQETLRSAFKNRA